MIITLAFGLTLLLAAQPGLAWHTPDEKPNVQFASLAGDERYAEDTAECRASGTHCAAVYPHVYDLLQPIATNLQRPPDCFPDLAAGFTGTPGIEPFWSFSRAELFSSPGFVEYHTALCENDNYRPRIHPERGLAGDILLSPHVDIIGHWYMSADTLEFSPLGIDGHEHGLAAGALPCLTVHMQLQTGRYPGVGQVLAEGRTTKTIVTTPELLGDGHPALPEDVCADSDGPIQGEQVTEFKVNLGRATGPIPEHTGYLINVMWYQHNAGSDDDPQLIVQREWNRHSGAEYANRVILPVENPISIDTLSIERSDGMAYIHTVIKSPWGSYDVDIRNIRVGVLGPTGPLELKHLDDPILRYSVDHGGHFVPVNATFPWDYTKEDLPPGQYRLWVSAPNWQHTADGHALVLFTIGDDPDAVGSGNAAYLFGVQEAPALPALIFVLATLAGVWSRRPRT